MLCKKCNLDKPIDKFSPSCIKKKWGYCRECRKKLPSQCGKQYKLYKDKIKKSGLTKKWSRDKLLRHPVSTLLSAAKNRVKRFGLEFNLDKSDIVIPEYCPILGMPIIVNPGSGRTGNAPSLDRMDNTKGYVKGNVIVISDRANVLKSSSTAEERKLMFDGYKRLLIN